MVLTELAWQDEEFTRRWLDDELLYYTREQAPEDAKRLYELRRQQIQTEGIMPPYVAQHQRRLSGRLS